MRIQSPLALLLVVPVVLLGGRVGSVAAVVGFVAAALLGSLAARHHRGLRVLWFLTAPVWGTAATLALRLADAPLAELPRSIGLVGYTIGGLLGASVLGRRQLRLVLRDSAVVAAGVLAVMLGPTALARDAETVLLVVATTAVLAPWGVVVVARRSAGRSADLWVVSFGLLLTGAVALAVGMPLPQHVTNAVELAASVLYAAGALHPSARDLLRREVEPEHRTTTGRIAVAAAGAIFCALVLEVRSAAGDDLAVWQSATQFLVAIVALWHLRTLFDLATADSSALRRASRRDPVTGCANEAGLVGQLTDGVWDGATLLAVEVAGLRSLLRRLGHHGGPELARAVVDGLQSAGGPDAVVARCDTEEFVLLVRADPQEVAAAVRRELGTSLYVTATSVSVGVDLRVGWCPVAADAPGAALHAARFAAQVDRTGAGTAFDAELQHRLEEERVLVRDVPAAVATDDVQPWFQPITETATGRVSGFEVLARWTHPELGSISPGVFIPIAESSGAIVELGASLLRQACRELAAWRELPGHGDLGIAVNVSPRQLLDPALGGTVASALDDAGLPAHALTLELTEGLLADLDRWGHVLGDLQRRGVLLAVDDFGTGYSSLAYLDQLAPDVVKLDRRFVQTLGNGRDDVARGILALLSQLRLPCVAEGVERERTLEVLEGLGCQRWQGFLHSRAVPAGEVERLLSTSVRSGDPAVPTRR